MFGDEVGESGGVIKWAKVPEVAPCNEGARGNAPRDQRRNCCGRVVGVSTGNHPRGCLDFAKCLPRIVVDPHFVRLGFKLRVTFDVHTIRGLCESELNVRRKCIGMQRRQRGFGPKIHDGFLVRGKGAASAPRDISQWVASTALRANLWRKDDRFKDDQGRKQLWLAQGRHDECRATHRVTDTDQGSLPMFVEHMLRHGDCIITEVLPGKWRIRWCGRVTKAAIVECGARACGEVLGDRCEYSTVKTSGMRKQNRVVVSGR